MRNLRRSLKIAPTHIDRTQSNQKVWDKVAQYEVHMQRISVTWKEAKLKLMGHILRASRYDALRQVIFETGTNAPKSVHCKRVGRPRADWVIETLKDALYALEEAVPQILDNEAIRKVYEAAVNRSQPF